MMALTIGIRVMHLWSLTLLMGVFGFLLLVARPAYEKGGPGDWPAFARFDHLLLRLSGWCVLVALGFSLLGLWVQSASVTGLALSDALTLEGLGGMLTATRYGRVWLMSVALMALLGGVLRFCKQERYARDWRRCSQKERSWATDD